VSTYAGDGGGAGGVGGVGGVGADAAGGCTNFEALSHEQLLAMLRTAQPDLVNSRAAALTAAAAALHSLSDDLHGHLGRLDWSGPAADAFRDWAGRISTATLQLGDYTATAGTGLSHAGDSLQSAISRMPGLPSGDLATVTASRSQGTPPYLSANPLTPAPDYLTPSQATAAQQRITAAHQEAIHQMTRVCTASGVTDVV
jgi:uncharacterized protein YukE